METSLEKVKITNRERIKRVLQRVAESNISLQIRAPERADVSVKGKAAVQEDIDQDTGLICFKIVGLSERGRAHIAAFAHTEFQIEFVLMSNKIVFYSRLVELTQNHLKLTIPDYLLSVERRKDARFPITTNQRAYISLHTWQPDIKDPTIPPFLSYQRKTALLQCVGDVSAGGLSIVTRFPSVCRFLQRGTVIENGSILLPLTPPIPLTAEVRWTKRLRENIKSEAEGENPQMIRLYKFGLQFANPSGQLQSELQKFIAKLMIAEAI